MSCPCVCLGFLCGLICGACSHAISTWFVFSLPGQSSSARISATRVPMLQPLPCTCARCSPPTCTHLRPQPPRPGVCRPGGRAVPVCTHVCFRGYTRWNTCLFAFSPLPPRTPPGPALPEASQSFSVGAPYSLPSHIFPGACLPALCFLFPSPGKTQALKKGGH